MIDGLHGGQRSASGLIDYAQKLPDQTGVETKDISTIDTSNCVIIFTYKTESRESSVISETIYACPSCVLPNRDISAKPLSTDVKCFLPRSC